MLNTVRMHLVEDNELFKYYKLNFCLKHVQNIFLKSGSVNSLAFAGNVNLGRMSKHQSKNLIFQLLTARSIEI